jgi:hypothetical protein
LRDLFVDGLTSLKSVLAGVWMERDDDLLNAEFRLSPPTKFPPMLAQTLIDRPPLVRPRDPEGAKPNTSPWCTPSRSGLRSRDGWSALLRELRKPPARHASLIAAHAARDKSTDPRLRN